MTTIDVVTIFPAMIDAVLSEGVIGRARVNGLVDVKARDLRDYTSDKHRVVDDMPFGGGPGMVLKPEPLFRAVDEITAERGAPDAVVLMTPQGRPLVHSEVVRFSRMSRLVVLCGRYEGVDERVTEALVTDEISIGDFVVSGGELPAMLMADAMGRLVEGVVGNTGSVEEDSFFKGLLDYPHYTRPEVLRGMRIPEILLSGHHENIRRWRKEQSLKATVEKRPDLLDTADLDAEAREILRKLGKF